MWEWKTKKVRNLPEQVAYNTERLNELQDGDTWTAIKELRLRILNIEGSYQDKSEKNMPNGYAGLNANGEIEANRILNAVYPIGSIYMSVNSVSPATLFGGTWERIQDRFLLAAGNTYAAGTTGGEATHTLTVDEMPSHKHNVSFLTNPNEGSTADDGMFASSGGNPNFSRVFSKIDVSNSGGGQPHNNMPPFLTVNIWKRTE